MDTLLFKNRLDAGEKLASKLRRFKDEEVVVFALTRGGVPVGKVVALRLNCQIEPVVIKKIGHPQSPEYAVGAVAADGEMVLNRNETDFLDQEWLNKEINRQQEVAKERHKFLIGARRPLDLSNKTAVIVDDGIATGLTMMAAIQSIKKRKPKKIIVAVPVAPLDTISRLEKMVDQVIVFTLPQDFGGAVGAFYEDFSQVSDEEVRNILNDSSAVDQDIDLKIGALTLPGILCLPTKTKSLVIFAHGSGSSRLSPRNTYVARVLQKAGIATLLFDLLTEKEDETYENRFDIDLITDRLVQVTELLLKDLRTKSLAIGYFGASTGSASALQAAVKMGKKIKAVVSRGGRPDLALEILDQVNAPTLLIVGGNDDVVIDLNKKAFAKLKAEKKLVIVPGATHLFEEPGTLEKVADLATNWFKKYLK